MAEILATRWSWAEDRLHGLADFWRVFRRHRAARAALCALAMIVVTTPTAVAVLGIEREAISANVLDGPSRRHPLGTDYLGRDILGRTLHGVNTSLVVGTAVALLGMSIGVTLGAVAGYYGGWVDHLIMRVADALLIVPTFFLVLSIAFIFGGRLLFVVILLGVTTWPQIARIVRAEVLALRDEAFVLAACALGVGDAKLGVPRDPPEHAAAGHRDGRPAGLLGHPDRGVAQLPGRGRSQRGEPGPDADERARVRRRAPGGCRRFRAPPSSCWCCC